MSDELGIVPRGRPTPESLEVQSVMPTYSAWTQSAQQAHLRDYLIILRKHVWLSLAFLLTVVTVVTIATFKTRPVYEAVSRVEVDRDMSNVLPFQGVGLDAMYYDMDNYIATEAKILQSETLGLATIQSMQLAQSAEFGAAPRPDVPGAPGDINAATKDQALAILGAFQSRLTVRRIPDSHLLEVHFEAFDPKLAAAIVNAHVQNFIEHSFRMRYESALKATDWLTQQLDELRVKVQQSEDKRVAYERDNQIWTIDEKQNTTTQKLADLNRQLTEAQVDEIQKQANYQLVRAGKLDALPQVMQSQVIQGLLSRRADLAAQYSVAVTSGLGPNYPTVKKLQSQLKEIDQSIATEKQNIANTIEMEYQGAQQREMLVSQALDKQKVEANAMSEKLVQYNILKREAEANKQLYDGLLQKLKEAGISAGLRSSDLRVVDPALVPGVPTRPQKMRSIGLAVLVGLIGGIGLAFLREYLDNTVKTPDDVEQIANLPALAVVPALTTTNGRGPKLLRRQTLDADERVELAAHEHPQSQISEAFRSLRTSLLLSRAERPPQTILVTSSLPREGKTTAVLNLAVTLAQLGDRTLIVDGDMRKPGISRFLGMGEGKHAGLSTYLAGVSSLDLVTVCHPAIPNLSVILSGPIPPNPADLLSSQRLHDGLAALREQYRFVVWDSPPIMAATDALIMSSLADGVLLVVRSGSTPKEAFSRARDLLGGVRSRLLGVVLNAVDISSPDYYYSYKYYPYHYGYGLNEPSRRRFGS